MRKNICNLQNIHIYTKEVQTINPHKKTICECSEKPNSSQKKMWEKPECPSTDG